MVVQAVAEDADGDARLAHGSMSGFAEGALNVRLCSSFVPAEHVLDGIHDGYFGVFRAIGAHLLRGKTIFAR
jgi:hypothetical protein